MAQAEAPALNPRALVLLVALPAAVLALAAACGGRPPEVEYTPPAGLPPGGPPGWPYVFSGGATAAGQSVPAGTPIFARIGSSRSLVAATLDGRYLNVVVGPTVREDLGHRITFHLGDPEGASVQAKETFAYELLSEIASFEMDLTFPRLP
ncbi:MAG: hypothetical protein FJ313_01220 [Gemmatimonadetes bacterium]|nr:hypothetical protein [Gemmatimonadota bacterium]